GAGARGRSPPPPAAATTTRLLEGAVTLRQGSPARLDSKSGKGADASRAPQAVRESELENEVAKNRQNAAAMHDLGDLYLRNGHPQKTLPCLAEVYPPNPSDLSTAYDLGVAYRQTGNLSAARQQVQALLKGADNAEYHSLSAKVEAKAGNFAEAAKEYQRAAQIAPSEQNIFDWGTELLAQRNLSAGLEVFKSGLEQYPKSPDLWIGRGIALYLRGDHDEAVRSLMQATDLDPTAYGSYIFLADASNASQKESPAVAARL